MIRVLLVDDSNIIKKLITKVIEPVPDIKIISYASNGQEAYEKTILNSPDLILMDINMPNIDGIESTKMIMKEKPTPIIIFSALNNELNENILPLEALKYGALSILKKPKGFDYDEISKELINQIRMYSKVKLKNNIVNNLTKKNITDGLKINKAIKPEIIVIGSSTGGPQALSTILSKLDKNLSLPIIIVQHITSSFTNSIANWLQNFTNSYQVKIAVNGEKIEPKNIYIPPADSHLLVDNNKKIIITKEKLHSYICPSIDITFSSIAKVYKHKSLAIILTGMGRDGALGMKDISDNNGYTLAQNKETCIVFGMPKAAIDNKSVRKILPLEKIASQINKTCL